MWTRMIRKCLPLCYEHQLQRECAGGLCGSSTRKSWFYKSNMKAWRREATQGGSAGALVSSPGLLGPDPLSSLCCSTIVFHLRKSRHKFREITVWITSCSLRYIIHMKQFFGGGKRTGTRRGRWGRLWDGWIRASHSLWVSASSVVVGWSNTYLEKKGGRMKILTRYRSPGLMWGVRLLVLQFSRLWGK